MDRMERNKHKALRNAFVLLLIVLLSVKYSHAQNDYPLDIKFYNFIQYDKNKFVFPGDSDNFERFFQKMDTLILSGEGKISIVQIGGSHVQADIYPGRTRERLQTFYPGMNGGYGFVFPYRMANTNNPLGYHVNYSGDWETCRNVEMNKNCNLGLSGITAITSNPSSTLTINLRKNNQLDYSFDRIRIFHSFGINSFVPLLDSVKIEWVEKDENLGFSLFYLDKSYKSLKIKLVKNDTLQNIFELYGISLENDDPGIVYNSIGINGASFNSFLRCNLLENHLKALNPDMVIISLGTNDAYTTKFQPEVYMSNYRLMLAKIKKVVPNAAILATVANDSYLFRRYPNKNTQLAADVIYKVAKEYNCGVWDFYEIMGGFNSSKTWLNENLMGKDLIHFNLEGYLLIGDLFFNAFIKSYDNHIARRNNK
jgi:lysophospholipase L1-like esterase